jgi:hypothetical protein
MTILDSYGLLDEYFFTHTSFNLKKNRKEVILVSENEPAEDASLTCALKEMEISGFLRSCIIDGQMYWTLFKPLTTFSQTLEINSVTAAGIASVINSACETLNNEDDKCNSRGITEKDLKNLIFLASKVDPKSLKE